VGIGVNVGVGGMVGVGLLVGVGVSVGVGVNVGVGVRDGITTTPRTSPLDLIRYPESENKTITIADMMSFR